MYVVVDKIVAILQVLSFADAIRGNENVYLLVHLWQQGILFLGNGGKEREQGVEVGAYTLTGREPDCTPRLGTARYDGRVQIVFLPDTLGKVFVEVFCRVSEGGKDDYLLIIAVYWVGKLMAKIVYQLL